jgi:hypothetical protein
MDGSKLLRHSTSLNGASPDGFAAMLTAFDEGLD